MDSMIRKHTVREGFTSERCVPDCDGLPLLISASQVSGFEMDDRVPETHSSFPESALRVGDLGGQQGVTSRGNLCRLHPVSMFRQDWRREQPSGGNCAALRVSGHGCLRGAFRQPHLRAMPLV